MRQDCRAHLALEESSRFGGHSYRHHFVRRGGVQMNRASATREFNRQQPVDGRALDPRGFDLRS